MKRGRCNKNLPGSTSSMSRRLRDRRRESLDTTISSAVALVARSDSYLPSALDRRPQRASRPHPDLSQWKTVRGLAAYCTTKAGAVGLLPRGSGRMMDYAARCSPFAGMAAAAQRSETLNRAALRPGSSLLAEFERELIREPTLAGLKAARTQGRQEVRAVEGPGAAGPGRNGPPRLLRVRTLHSTRDQTRDALQVLLAPGPVARAGREGPRHLNPSASTATPRGHWLHVGFRSIPQTTRRWRRRDILN